MFQIKERVSIKSLLDPTLKDIFGNNGFGVFYPIKLDFFSAILLVVVADK